MADKQTYEWIKYNLLFVRANAARALMITVNATDTKVTNTLFKRYLPIPTFHANI